MRRIQRNRRIAVFAGIMVLAFLAAVFFCNYEVTAEKANVYKYYTEITVGRDDTLWDIAERYCTEEYDSMNSYIKEVQEINQLGIEVQYGQRIMIPYYSEEVK